MPTPGFIPVGEEFHATIRRPGLEEVLEDAAGVKMRFPSAAAAIIHARRIMREQDMAWRATRGEPETSADRQIIERWKHEKAEGLRREREAFDMRKVEVVTKKRRFAKWPGGA